MSFPFLRVFELLWGYEGATHDKRVQSWYYGLAIGYWFFGIVTLTLRKDSHGIQSEQGQ